MVFGSLPPAGRDIDLLVRAGARSALERALPQHGFSESGRTYARFQTFPPEAVEMFAVESWNLAESEQTGLFEEARPLPGHANLARPSPHHVLLLVATKLVNRDGPMTAAELTRVQAALAEAPQAFERATDVAADWRAGRALALLRRELEDQSRATSWARALALREHLGVGSLRSLLPAPKLLRGLARPKRRGILIALSGLDGAGKSAQATRLRDALEWLDRDAVVIWRSLVNPPAWLTAVAGKVRRLLSANERSEIAAESPPQSGHRPLPPAQRPMAPDRPGRLSNLAGWRGSAVAYAWSSLLTVRLALGLARATWPRLLRGQVVVCDRYLLDAWVELSYFYGERRRFGAHLALLRLATPAPRLAYLIDVSVQTASQRKADFSPEQNQRRAQIYRDYAQSMGVRRLDGEQGLDDLAQVIGGAAWERL